MLEVLGIVRLWSIDLLVPFRPVGDACLIGVNLSLLVNVIAMMDLVLNGPHHIFLRRTGMGMLYLVLGLRVRVKHFALARVDVLLVEVACPSGAMTVSFFPVASIGLSPPSS